MPAAPAAMPAPAEPEEPIPSREIVPPPGTCDTDLFGRPVRKFDTALQRYGIWPTTVWPISPLDAYTAALKRELGDRGEARGAKSGSWATLKKRGPLEEDDTREWRGDPTLDLYKLGAGYFSIFNPRIASWILNLWAPAEGICADPFGGGGTRAALAALRGLRYIGCELREEEVAAVNSRLSRLGVTPDMAELVCGDARYFAAAWTALGAPPADFLYTCPPYYNLEEYGGGEADLSAAESYPAFLDGCRDVIEQCRQLLRPGALAVWVVGLHRCPKTRECLPLNHDIARLHREGGYALHEEVCIYHQANIALRRAGNFERGSRLLVRQHEYALVFRRR
jgi:hypothetical protein